MTDFILWLIFGAGIGSYLSRPKWIRGASFGALVGSGVWLAAVLVQLVLE